MTDPLRSVTEALADRYRIARVAGEGGMAIVFQATDVRHDRQVAVKVLRPDVAAAIGAERFLAEIRTTALLQHPHILALFDSGRIASPAGADLLYYVMPFVEGESLRDRLTREKQLPVAEAVRLTLDIADALAYAHQRGVLHRDIKPENILLSGGRALLADFGIALAVSRAGTEGRLTQTGLSLGTPQYMSPEQALGERTMDARTDVYSLGATLYEMLCGEPPHSGPTAQVILARAATELPRPIRESRPAVPAALEAAVLTALRTVPADRFAGAAEFAAALRASAEAPAAPRGAPRAHRKWAAIAGAVAVAGLIVVARPWASRTPAERPAAVRTMIPLPAGVSLRPGLLPFDVSRDGSRIVFAAERSGRMSLYLRPLGDFAERGIPGTEGAELPFFSPDGRWIAYFAGNQLWKVAESGGAPFALASVRAGNCGASWGHDDNIYIGRCDGSLHRLPGAGGALVAIPARPQATGDTNSAAASPVIRDLRWPSLLPDGRHALVATEHGVGVLRLATGRLTTLFPGKQPRYLPTGHILFETGEGRMRIVAFDVRTLQISGEPQPAIETFRGPGDGGAYIAVAGNGTLVYVAGTFQRTLIVTDGAGRVTDMMPEKRGYRFPRFSPDGRLIAVTVDPRPSDIWLVDPARRLATRLTTSGGNIIPVWSHDGERLTFTARNALATMNRGGGDVRRVETATSTYPSNWGRDGTILAYRLRQFSGDLVALLPGDSQTTPLLTTPADERQPALSPNERWLAYVSDVSGANEVYVSPYPAPEQKVMVSRGGGQDPRWSADGRMLFYRRGSTIMVAEVNPPTVVGPVRELFVSPYDFSQSENWDVTDNGERFVFVEADAMSARGFNIILNWFEEIRARP